VFTNKRFTSFQFNQNNIIYNQISPENSNQLTAKPNRNRHFGLNLQSGLA